MAKLSAHGTEVARLVVERTLPDHRHETHYSFRSDGHVLRRIVGLDIHAPGSRTDHGWKLWKRMPSPDPARLRAMAEEWRDDIEASDGDRVVIGFK